MPFLQLRALEQLYAVCIELSERLRHPIQKLLTIHSLNNLSFSRLLFRFRREHNKRSLCRPPIHENLNSPKCY